MLQVPHVGDGFRDRAGEAVVGDVEVGNEGFADFRADVAGESVVVEEGYVEVRVEEARREGSLELVEAEVEVDESGGSEDSFGEDACEFVVAEIWFGGS